MQNYLLSVYLHESGPGDPGDDSSRSLFVLWPRAFYLTLAGVG